jgi:hypothetical protein
MDAIDAATKAGELRRVFGGSVVAGYLGTFCCIAAVESTDSSSALA